MSNNVLGVSNSSVSNRLRMFRNFKSQNVKYLSMCIRLLFRMPQQTNRCYKSNSNLLTWGTRRTIQSSTCHRCVKIPKISNCMTKIQTIMNPWPSQDSKHPNQIKIIYWTPSNCLEYWKHQFFFNFLGTSLKKFEQCSFTERSTRKCKLPLENSEPKRKRS